MEWFIIVLLTMSTGETFEKILTNLRFKTENSCQKYVINIQKIHVFQHFFVIFILKFYDSLSEFGEYVFLISNRTAPRREYFQKFGKNTKSKSFIKPLKIGPQDPIFGQPLGFICIYLHATYGGYPNLCWRSYGRKCV